MLDYLATISPIIVLLLVYFVRLERRLVKITTDIDWIIKTLNNITPT